MNKPRISLIDGQNEDVGWTDSGTPSNDPIPHPLIGKRRLVLSRRPALGHRRSLSPPAVDQTPPISHQVNPRGFPPVPDGGKRAPAVASVDESSSHASRSKIPQRHSISEFAVAPEGREYELPEDLGGDEEPAHVRSMRSNSYQESNEIACPGPFRPHPVAKPQAARRHPRGGPGGARDLPHRRYTDGQKETIVEDSDGTNMTRMMRSRGLSQPADTQSSTLNSQTRHNSLVSAHPEVPVVLQHLSALFEALGRPVPRPVLRYMVQMLEMGVHPSAIVKLERQCREEMSKIIAIEADYVQETNQRLVKEQRDKYQSGGAELPPHNGRPDLDA